MTLLAWFSVCWGRSLAWGSAAEWVGGVGTAGALILGLQILRRDHANGERSLIDQVGWWHGQYKGHYGWIVTNHGLLPVHVWVEPTSEDEALFFAEGQAYGAAAIQEGHDVGPGQTIQFRHGDNPRPGSGRDAIARVVVRDNAGRQWEHSEGKGWSEVAKRRRR